MITFPMTRKALIELNGVDFFTGNSDYLEGVLYAAYRGALKPRCRILNPRGKKIAITFNTMDDWQDVYNRLDDLIDNEFWNNKALLNYQEEFQYFINHGEPEKKTPVKISHDWHQEVEDHVNATYIIMGKFLKKNTSSLPIKWSPKIKISWHPNRSSSRGGCHGRTGHYSGHGGASFALGHHFEDGSWTNKHRFIEYSHIKNSKYIGTVVSDDWRVRLDALVAHEIAHVAQRYLGRNICRYRKIMKVSHGEGWKDLYRMLRIEFVNSRI